MSRVATEEHFPMANKEMPDEVKTLKRKKYEKELRRLQAELCKLQAWVKYKGLRAIVVFEGRDAAGKGGTIKAITERVSPRVCIHHILKQIPYKKVPHERV